MVVTPVVTTLDLLLPRMLAPIPTPKQQHIHIGIAIMMRIHMMNAAMAPPIIAPILTKGNDPVIHTAYC